MYDKGATNGTVAFRVRGDSPGGAIARITTPGGKLANMVSFLKVVNCIRTDNMSISHDSFQDSESLVRDIKAMIQKDMRQLASDSCS